VVHEILGTGRGAALTGTDLSNLLGLKVRELTRIIEQERREGHPICASCTRPQGYYLPQDDTEVEGYCRSLAHRMMELQRTYDAVAASKGRCRIYGSPD
jgi:hypothetical protein